MNMLLFFFRRSIVLIVTVFRTLCIGLYGNLSLIFENSDCFILPRFKKGAASGHCFWGHAIYKSSPSSWLMRFLNGALIVLVLLIFSNKCDN